MPAPQPRTDGIVRSGERDPATVFSCRLTPSAAAEPYVVRGHFLPNRLTPDPNANKVHETTLPVDDPPYSTFLTQALYTKIHVSHLHQSSRLM